MARNTKGPPVGIQISGLPFVRVVDMMLLEGTSAPDVAKFIQEDQKALLDVNSTTLTNELSVRLQWLRAQRASLHEEIEAASKPSGGGGGSFGDDDDGIGGGGDGDDGDGGGFLGAAVPRFDSEGPSTLARAAYKRLQGGIDEMIEFEALFLAQRSRIESMMAFERAYGRPIEKLGNEIQIAGNLLAQRIDAAKTKGIIGGGEHSAGVLDVRGYSVKTAEVLAKPESRQRIVGILDRARRLSEKKPPEGES